MNSSNVIERANVLRAERNHESALKLLLDSVCQHPNDKELRAECGLLLCLMQRELDAIEHALVAENSELSQILVDYFFCRAQFAARLKISDEIGANALQRIMAESKVQPEDVGIELSACLIVRDEEKNLPRCLDSIQDHVDEIIVIDTGSSDASVAIAESFGAVTGRFDWCDDFAAARNQALAVASKPWILWIDADEELVAGSEKMLREALMRPHFGGFHVRIENVMSESGEADLFVHSPIRIFRRHPRITFQGRIHEQVLPSIEAAGFPTAHLDGVVLKHYGYRPSAMTERNKIERTVHMLLREIEDAPNDPFHWFNLTNAYVVNRQYDQALTAGTKCVELITSDASYGPLAFHLVCTALIECRKPQSVEMYCSRAAELGFSGVLSEFDLAQANFAMQRLDAALRHINNCMSLPWPEDLVGDYGIKTHKSLILRAQILASLGKLNDALTDIEHALAIDPSFSVAIATKGAILAGLGQDERAIPLLEATLDERICGKQSRIVLSKIYLASNDATKAMNLLRPLWESGDRSPELFALYVTASERELSSEHIITLYDEYAKTNQPDPDMLVNWGRSLLAQGMNERALECFSEAAKRNPQDANTRFNCADALYALARFQDAAHMYESGLRLQPNCAPAWFAMGNCFFQLRMFDGASISYREALRLRPIYPEATANLSLIDEMQMAA